MADIPDFIDLSTFTYSVSSVMNDLSVKVQNSLDMKMKIECSNCSFAVDNLTIKCKENEFLQINIILHKGIKSIKIPFNLTCDDSINYFTVQTINFKSDTKSIKISWQTPSDDITNYLLYLIDKNGNYTHRIINKISEYKFNNLNEKSWYQICIATINTKWITSTFTCQQILTDFSITGPITNMKVSADTNQIYLLWQKPEYKYDIPQGYIVYLKGNNADSCRTIIISMTNDPITNIDQSCKHQDRQSWTELQQLEINNLPAYSDFTINIIPYNKYKPHATQSVSITTKQGESEAVQELKITRYDHSHMNMHIQFKEPSIINGIIVKYRIKIILQEINICTKTNKIVHESHFKGKTEGWIYLENATKCGFYLLEVTPINGWHLNNGLGKAASASFQHSPGKPSAISVKVQFQSQNSISLYINELNRQCDLMGYTIEIINTNNQYDCAVNAFTNIQCKELETEILKSCTNVSYLKFNNKSSSIKSVFSGMIQHQSQYKYKISIIAKQIHQINSEIIKNIEMADCFTDCYKKGFPYVGIRSTDKDGNTCNEWKYSKYSLYKGVKSNICSMSNSDYPWCPTRSSYGYCDIPDCSTVKISTGCVTITATESNTESLKINWSLLENNDKIIGYIILLHNTDHFCEQYQIQLCDTCPSQESLENKVKNIYLSCKSKITDSPIKFETEFKQLYQNQKYILYLMPIVSKSEIGEVKNLTVNTKLAKPNTPQNVQIISKSLTEIEFAWDKPIEFRQQGKPEYYDVMQNSNSIYTQQVYKEQIKYSNLEMCTKYCFTVSSVNKAGSSEWTTEKCWFTLAPKPETVAIDKIQSGYFTDQILTWKYLGSDFCAKMYILEYYIKYTNEICETKSNKTKIKLNNLKLNVIYAVKIKVEGLMETENNQTIGLHSVTKEFYTGLVYLNLTNYIEELSEEKNSLNISWTIVEEARGSIFEFIIILKNSSKNCENLIHFQCNKCQFPWNWTNLPEDKKLTRHNLLKCSSKSNYSFKTNDIFFNSVITSKITLSNFSVEIYGINLLGVHQLNEKITTLPQIKNSRSAIIITFLFLVLIIFIILFIIMKKKKVEYFLFYNKDSRNKYSTIALTETVLSNNKKTSIENNKNHVDTKTTISNSFKKQKLPDKNSGKGIQVTEFIAYFERMSQNNNEELIKEYKKLGLESKNVEAKLNLTFEAGKDSHNSKKNRFVNILPFDQNRVKVGDKGFPFDYVNASYIPFKDNERKTEYIASQGPIDDSLSDFWQMIWEQNIKCIIMLTQTMEGDKFKCLQYWPEKVGKTSTFGSNNQFQVKLTEENDFEGHIERLFMVENKENNGERIIMHMHMHTWFDHSAPDLNYFDKLLFRFQEVVTNNATYPYLVHCSAGVGRTGTLICLDRIVKDLVAGCQEINIYETVLKLRHYRNFIVQRHAQYTFIHDYLTHFIRKYMKTEKGEETLYFNED